MTSSWGGRRYLPYAFTEQSVAMHLYGISSVYGNGDEVRKVIER